MAQWLSQWSRSLISNHIKDIKNFSSPQKSVVSNIAFRKGEYRISLMLTLLSELNTKKVDTLWGLTSFKHSIFNYSFQFCIHDFLSGYNWFVWPNLLPLLTICSDKKTIRVNTSYFSYLFPNKLMTTEIVQKWKENYLVVTYQMSKKIWLSFCIPALITFPECNRFIAIFISVPPRACALIAKRKPADAQLI